MHLYGNMAETEELEEWNSSPSRQVGWRIVVLSVDLQWMSVASLSPEM